MTPLYYITMYTDGPDTLWNVIDGSTQEWVRRYPTAEQAQAYADELSTIAIHHQAKDDGDYTGADYDDGQPYEQQEWHDYDRDC